ncbi:hypothetical protein [Wolinella succinogenes]|uniref:hypothetical protein n=1 Tax=Wolinella succinogenes TaxID=844 RepID=UPI00240A6B2E|nr:hypothetical protein [Wolinella succinogenes]
MNKTPLFALLALLAFGLLTYLYFTPSYQGAFLAQYELSRGEYKEAERLAQESLGLDPYNRLAMSVLKEAKKEREWQGLLREAKERKGEIERSLGARLSLEQKRRLEWLVKMTLEQFASMGSGAPSSLELKEERERLESWYKRLDRELKAL